MKAPLSYLMEQLKPVYPSFVAEWGRVPEADRETLKRWAQEEMDFLKI
jgi:hypothetical protein